jgi:hypothetical protein
MKTKPEKGAALLLLCYAQKSRVGLSVPVECRAADEPRKGEPASKAEVWVMLPDARVVAVTRADVEPA